MVLNFPLRHKGNIFHFTPKYVWPQNFLKTVTTYTLCLFMILPSSHEVSRARLVIESGDYFVQHGVVTIRERRPIGRGVWSSEYGIHRCKINNYFVPYAVANLLCRQAVLSRFWDRTHSDPPTFYNTNFQQRRSHKDPPTWNAKSWAHSSNFSRCVQNCTFIIVRSASAHWQKT